MNAREANLRTWAVILIVWLAACGGLDDDSLEQAASSAKTCKPPKIAVCHVPPGNPANAHTICIGRAALKAHLGHGDPLGGCQPPQVDPPQIEPPSGEGDGVHRAPGQPPPPVLDPVF
jgi:hypothetical protein